MKNIFAGALVFWAPLQAFAEPIPNKNEFVREDWIATVEPDRLNEWGDQWAINNFLLPYRALQTGKHRFETRYLNNYRFGSENGGAGGMFLRLTAGTFADLGLFIGGQN